MLQSDGICRCMPILINQYIAGNDAGNTVADDGIRAIAAGAAV
jgi:hypothetical protein